MQLMLAILHSAPGIQNGSQTPLGRPPLGFQKVQGFRVQGLGFGV